MNEQLIEAVLLALYVYISAKTFIFSFFGFV